MPSFLILRQALCLDFPIPCHPIEPQTVGPASLQVSDHTYSSYCYASWRPSQFVHRLRAYQATVKSPWPSSLHVDLASWHCHEYAYLAVLLAPDAGTPQRRMRALARYHKGGCSSNGGFVHLGQVSAQFDRDL